MGALAALLSVSQPRQFQHQLEYYQRYRILKMKKCSKCEEVKALDQFYKQGASKDKLRSNCKECHSAQAKHWRESNPDIHAARAKSWDQNHPGRQIARIAKHRLNKLNRVPAWLTREDFLDIEAFYIEAARLTTETGVQHHVDHLHPLKGETASGLHCPLNLQILTASENIAKGNKPSEFTPLIPII
jgi:hypothetical protein